MTPNGHLGEISAMHGSPSSPIRRCVSLKAATQDGVLRSPRSFGMNMISSSTLLSSLILKSLQFVKLTTWVSLRELFAFHISTKKKCTSTCFFFFFSFLSCTCHYSTLSFFQVRCQANIITKVAVRRTHFAYIYIGETTSLQVTNNANYIYKLTLKIFPPLVIKYEFLNCNGFVQTC